MVAWEAMMKQVLVPLAALVALVGCAGPAERARDRLQPVIRETIAEKAAWNDFEWQSWEDLGKLRDLLACNLSKGAIDRNASPEQRAEIEAVKCPE